MTKNKKSRNLSMGPGADALAIPRELTRISTAWMRYGIFGLPFKIGRAAIKAPIRPSLLFKKHDDYLLSMIGDSLMELFAALGPVYGKAAQISLSRLNPKLQNLATNLGLTRLYDQWPAMSANEVIGILNTEIPDWQTHFELDPRPLGVASMAQVHPLKGLNGQEWVVKIIKPKAKQRLNETLAAIHQTLGIAEPLALTRTSKRLIKEVRELCTGFEKELHLNQERQMIERMRQTLERRKTNCLIIPRTYPQIHSDNILIIERFRGTPLSEVVSGQTVLNPQVRKKLARKILQELLIQVFEIGLFHGDPHAGNLILLEDGNVGLFDWGLAGELLDSDRRHIAAILKALIALDQEKLIDALFVMGEESGQKQDRDNIKAELSKVIKMITKSKDTIKKPALHELMEACLQSADRLKIPVPDGLLMMAKSLVTIEGLARGIDPKVSMLRVATPVLFKAAKPGLTDLWALTMRLPRLLSGLRSHSRNAEGSPE